MNITEVPTSSTPDVPFCVNTSLREIDTIFKTHKDVIDPLKVIMDAGIAYYRGTLAAGTDLRTLTSRLATGWYVLSGSLSYVDTPPGAPAGITADMFVWGTSVGGAEHKIIYRNAGGIYERNQTSTGTPNNFTAYRRIDRLDDSIYTRLNAIEGINGGAGWHAMRDRGPLPDGTDLSTLTGKTWNGLWTLSASRTYTGLPPGFTYPTGAEFEVMVSGVGGGRHWLAGRNDGGVYENHMTTLTSWKGWRRTDRADDALYARVAPLERAVGTPGEAGLSSEIDSQTRMLAAQIAKSHPALTGWEATGRWSTRSQGDLYLDQLVSKYPAIKLRTLGYTVLGYPIRAAHLGNPAGPAMLLQAGQHGDEVASREAALIWLRELAESTDPALATWLANNCIVFVPTVNADMITKTRLSSTGTDLNRNWVLQSTPEVAAAVSVFSLYNVLVAIDAHEGGGTTQMELDVSPSPEVPSTVDAMNDLLFAAVTDAFTAAGRPVGEFPSETALTWAMNHMSAVQHVPCLLTESPSLLAPNIYTPDPASRVNDQLLAFRTVLAHFRANQAAYAAAKAGA
jgi:hypothetical protein